MSDKGKWILVGVGLGLAFAALLIVVGILLWLKNCRVRNQYSVMSERVERASESLPSRPNNPNWPPSTSPYTRYDASLVPLPKFWRMGTDPRTGKRFFYQHHTGVVSSKRPKGIYR